MATTISPSELSSEEAKNVVWSELSQRHIDVLLAHRTLRKGGEAVDLICVNEDTSLESTLEILCDNGVLALPVYRTPPDDPAGRLYTGIISVHDIMEVTVFQRLMDRFDATVSSSLSDTNNYLELSEEMHAYFQTPIKTIVGKTFESSNSWTFHSTDPLSSLLVMFTGPYHRLLIIDDKKASNMSHQGQSITMITQTDLAAYLADALKENLTKLPLALSKALSVSVTYADELQRKRVAKAEEGTDTALTRGVKKRHVVVVPASCSAIRAFRIMYTNHVHAVAVVDDNKEMAANLSASDLRGVTKETLGNLELSVFEYLEGIKRKPDQIKADQLRLCTPTTTVGEALIEALSSHVHRIWIVGEHDTVMGVVTLSDIFNIIIPEDKFVAE